MRAAMQQAREGHGPVLLEMHVVRPVGLVGSETSPDQPFVFDGLPDWGNGDMSDPLVRCQHYLQAHGAWDDNWAKQLCARISTEIECAWHDVLHDALQSL
jgi:2-oxoisovalerate dehydrogenase E1 component subunit alpha